jgi:UMF1 family MFS transporter
MTEDSNRSGLPRGAVAWAVFEGARNPYVILVVIYIFAPYLASVLIGDAVKGQELISRVSTAYSFVVMATAPFLGAAVDNIGRRKGGLFLVVAAMVPLEFSLWWAKPGGGGLGAAGALAVLATLGVLFPYSEVLHNSLLVRAAGIRKAHTASGLGQALGNTFALVSLSFCMWAFALPGTVDWSWAPKEPLFGLSQAAHEPERIVGPISAVLFALGAIPLFLVTPDAPRTSTPIGRAFTDGARQIWRVIRNASQHRDAVIFLTARMFYLDGMTAILIYAGVYASGVMAWGPLQMLIYGILLTVLAVLGGFVGGWLDASIGAKRAVQLEIFMTILGITGMLGMAKDKILYVPYDLAVHAPIWNGPFLTTLPEWVYIAIGFSNAIFITAHYASSRTLLTRLTPPDQTGLFFGAFALSGTATLWLGSLLVTIGTHVFKTLQGGFGTILILLTIGFIGLLFVRGRGDLAPIAPG